MTMPDPSSLLWFDALPDPALLLNPAGGGTVRHANLAAAGYFGLARSALHGRALVALWPELAGHLTTGDAAPRTLRLRATGSWAWVDARIFPAGDLMAVQLSDATGQQLASDRHDGLLDLLGALSRSLTAPEAAGTILEHGREATGASSVTVFTLDATSSPVLLGSVGVDPETVAGWQSGSDGKPGLVRDALLHRQPTVRRTADVEEADEELETQPPVPVVTVALPLIFAGQPLGVLAVGYGGAFTFDGAVKSSLHTLADALTQALTRARLLVDERRARDSAALLFDLTAALADTRTPLDVARVIAQIRVPGLEGGAGVVWRLDTEQGALVPVDPHRPVPEPSQLPLTLNDTHIGAECARTDAAVFIGRDASPDSPPVRPGMTDGPAIAALPLRTGGSLTGVLTFTWPQPVTFDPSLRSLLTVLAGQCALALEHIQLATVEREQAQLLDLAQDAVIVRSASNHVTYWNPAAEALYGFTAQEAHGRVLHDLLHTTAPGTDAALTGTPGTQDTWTGEVRQTTRDGREVVVSSRQSVRRDDTGVVTAILEINRDVTLKRAAQNALRHSEARYRALIEATDQYVWTNSSTGEMTGDQPGWARLTGQTPDEYRGFGWADRLHPDDREPAVAAWQEAVRTRSPYRIEQRVQGQNGAYRTFLVRAVPLLDDGTVREWVGLHSDITELKRAERTLRAWGSELERQVLARTQDLRAANEELSAFAYTASHDLRAPVRHVGSFAGLLRRTVADNPRALRYTDIIEGAAARMETLIDALLLLARSGATDLQTTTVSLGPVVDSVRGELDADPERTTARWVIHDLPTVQADAGLIRQVLVNLLGNAVKYSRRRTDALIEVWAEPADTEVVIRVRDNGAGFDPQYAGKLFGVFQRLHSDTEFEGVGVGLANVRRIVEKHGGRVWAEGHPGVGATFSFSLPQEPAPAPD